MPSLGLLAGLVLIVSGGTAFSGQMTCDSKGETGELFQNYCYSPDYAPDHFPEAPFKLWCLEDESGMQAWKRIWECHGYAGGVRCEIRGGTAKLRSVEFEGKNWQDIRLRCTKLCKPCPTGWK